MLDEVNHPIRRIQVNDVDGKQHSECVNASRGDQPDAIVRFQSDPPQQSFEAQQ
jgi:hypothetical protein